MWGDSVLVGQIELRLFENEEDAGVPPIVAPQLVVHGLAYPDLVRACIEVSGRFEDFHVVEDGFILFFPENFDAEEARRERALWGQDADIDPVQPHLLHVCSCGMDECYNTSIEVRRHILNGEAGLLIETSWCRWFRENPYPVPAVFVPLASWLRAAVGTGQTPPHSDHAEATPELRRLLGEDPLTVLERYRAKMEEKHRRSGIR